MKNHPFAALKNHEVRLTDEQIVQAIAANDEELLVRATLNIPRIIAARHRSHMREHAYELGVFFLPQMIRTYKPDRGSSLRSWIYFKLPRLLVDAIRAKHSDATVIHFPRSVVEKLKLAGEAVPSYASISPITVCGDGYTDATEEDGYMMSDAVIKYFDSPSEEDADLNKIKRWLVWFYLRLPSEGRTITRRGTFEAYMFDESDESFLRLSEKLGVTIAAVSGTYHAQQEELTELLARKMADGAKCGADVSGIDLSLFYCRNFECLDLALSDFSGLPSRFETLINEHRAGALPLSLLAFRNGGGALEMQLRHARALVAERAIARHKGVAMSRERELALIRGTKAQVPKVEIAVVEPSRLPENMTDKFVVKSFTVSEFMALNAMHKAGLFAGSTVKDMVSDVVSGNVIRALYDGVSRASLKILLIKFARKHAEEKTTKALATAPKNPKESGVQKNFKRTKAA